MIRMERNLVDKWSFVFAAVVLVLGILIFFNDTNEFLGSLGAAILAAALAWISYILVRLVVLTIKN